MKLLCRPTSLVALLEAPSLEFTRNGFEASRCPIIEKINKIRSSIINLDRIVQSLKRNGNSPT